MNDRVVVILTNGGVVSLEPWHDSVPGILEAWLLGQAGGAAIADVVFGACRRPGGWPRASRLRLEDTPRSSTFPARATSCATARASSSATATTRAPEVPVRYPFGHGLSYTEFEYTDLEVTQGRRGPRSDHGHQHRHARRGSEVVQLYIAPPPAARSAALAASCAPSPGSTLDAGDRSTVEFALGDRDFSDWDGDWVIDGGEHTVEIGRSASDIVLAAPVAKPRPKAKPLTLESSVAEFLAHPVTGPILERSARASGAQDAFGLVTMMPMRRLLRMPGTGGSGRQMDALVRVANNPVVRGVAALVGRRRGL